METILEFINQNIFQIYILCLAIFLGFEVISKVPTVLHTPLMSVTNAISSVIIVGALIAVAVSNSDSSQISLYVGSIAVFLAAINIFGGFLVTMRMLAMYKKGKKK